MPHPHKAETDLAAEHQKVKSQRAQKWGRQHLLNYYAIEPRDIDPDALYEAERIAAGMLSGRGQ